MDSNASDPTPLSRRNSKSKRHSRGPSFAIKDLFRNGDSDGTDDRAPSVQSAPEDIDDYYAISAYYGIDDEDGWNGNGSRRSSMFGDYGRITSRRQSNRMVGMTEQDAPIKKLFADKLAGHHLASGSTVDQLAAAADVADLFSDEKMRNKQRFNQMQPTIAEHPDESMDDHLLLAPSAGIADRAEAVADLFQDRESRAATATHSKEPTYTGVRTLFGNDEDDDDDDDLDNLTVQRKASSNAPRPSSNVALWKTFDALSLSQRPKESILRREASPSGSAPAEESPAVLPWQQVPAAGVVDEEQLQLRIDEVREEERAKMTLIEEEIKERFEGKLEGMRADVEAQLRESLRNTLSESLRPNIRQECRRELEEEMSDRVRQQVDERMAAESEQQIDAKMQEMQHGFDSKMEALENSMNDRAERHRKEVETMERSKYELIQHTAKEIDSLRQIIKDHFQQHHESGGGNLNLQNLQFALGGLLKWT